MMMMTIMMTSNDDCVDRLVLVRRRALSSDDQPPLTLCQVVLHCIVIIIILRKSIGATQIMLFKDRHFLLLKITLYLLKDERLYLQAGEDCEGAILEADLVRECSLILVCHP